MHTLRMLWAAHNEEMWIRRRQRINRRREEVIAEMPEMEFIHRFRLDKRTFRRLCNDLRHLTSLRGTMENPIELKVLCTLSFLATGSYQRIVGLSQYMVQRTASRCIDQVVQALNHPAVLGKWIVFPQIQQERTRLKLEFQRKFLLPGIIGCIDCSHIAIVKPSVDEHLFYNRKGYHSLNVQMVCDMDLKIRNVNAKFGGATHDAFIWTSSRVEYFLKELHQNHQEQVWLLGDSGYPLRPWLLTPILDAAPGSPEETYTQRHIQARNCIERCFGLLKSRWRCLLRHRTLHYDPVKAAKIVLACSVLHNIAIDARLPPPSTLVIEETTNQEPSNIIGDLGTQNELMQGRATRNNLLLRL